MITTIEQFGAELALHMGLEVEGPFTAAVDLFADWGLDSLQAFQMIITAEAMADALVPPAAIPEIFTLGDAYAYYRSMADPG